VRAGGSGGQSSLESTAPQGPVRPLEGLNGHCNPNPVGCGCRVTVVTYWRVLQSNTLQRSSSALRG